MQLLWKWGSWNLKYMLCKGCKTKSDLVYIWVHCNFKKRGATHPLTQVVSEQQISWEVVREGCVKLQHLLQGIAFDDVEVTVGQGSDVGAGLSQSHFFPENISKYISLTCRRRAESLCLLLRCYSKCLPGMVKES